MFLEFIFNFFSYFHHNRICRYVQHLNIQRLIDVGSHKGEFLQIFTSVSSIKIFFCFEPQKLAFNVLKKKFKKNKKIKTFNYALGNRNHKKKLYLSNLTSTTSLAKFNKDSLYLKFKNLLTGDNNNKRNGGDGYLINIKTLDKVFKNISLKKTLLKIDVEGYEIYVLKGALKKIKEITYILIEHRFGNHYQTSFKEVKVFLLKNGFKIIKNFYFPTFHYKDILFKNSYKNI
jgi:FkbM family methyltransferase